MKTALVLAATFAFTTGACMAGDSCSKSSCETKKVSLMSKIFKKKSADVEAKKSSHGDTDMQVSGTNFIIN